MFNKSCVFFVLGGLWRLLRPALRHNSIKLFFFFGKKELQGETLFNRVKSFVLINGTFLVTAQMRTSITRLLLFWLVHYYQYMHSIYFCMHHAHLYICVYDVEVHAHCHNHPILQDRKKP